MDSIDDRRLAHLDLGLTLSPKSKRSMARSTLKSPERWMDVVLWQMLLERVKERREVEESREVNDGRPKMKDER